jgi:hypothetical protein
MYTNVYYTPKKSQFNFLFSVELENHKNCFWTIREFSFFLSKKIPLGFEHL